MNIQRFVISAVIFLSFTLVQFNFAQGNDVVKLSVKEPSIKVEQGKEFNVDLGLAIDNGWHINSQKPHDDFLIPSEITAKGNGIKLTKVKYPKAHDIKLAFSEAPLSVYEGSVVAGLILRADKNAPVGNQKVNITLDYQACNDMSCMPPTDVSIEFTVEVIENKSEDTAEITTPVETDSNDSEAEFEQLKKNSQQSQSSDENSIASTLEGSGIFLSLIFVFLAGLALNLTPCVYPLIPITIGYFGGQAEGKTSRLVLLGLLYMLGMAITYSVVGVITSLSGAVFGSLLQNPIVIIAIVLLFVALALSQFGVYEFKLPDSLVAKAGGAKGGAYGAFFMGLTMGIVAAPCIGPFVLGLVTYVAAKGDPFYGFLMFFVLALGLGFPYLLLAIFSGKIKSLPRAGIWMEGVKHIFGLLLIGMAFYFLDPILPKSIQGYTLPIFGIIAALILLFFDKTANDAKGFRTFKTVFSVLVLAISVYALIPSEKLEPEWKQFTIHNYQASLNNNEKMVIDFYADWCIPCKELDALTFSDKRIIDQFENFTVYKVDMTKNNETNEQLRKKFNVVGMPTVLVIDSKGNELKRITGFVNADEFLRYVSDID
ncbi:MAG: thiol:disulfide interchange protein [Ignavibacteriales bacterium UTCHB2]|jgi:thiol:disulfide interchange protein DsbD|nr:MAG: Thiol:disulfide interchange protein DsbD precursor [Ignavibacteria bacterium ADurb.Bin266]OQY70861.1 MAG: thiol:disulfide interchange protein [Ignavibacteriales bacterium UTCHB2]HQI40994.1 protein-disulfide reductase DsbD [Ignavibacteriaceae bacterium]